MAVNVAGPGTLIAGMQASELDVKKREAILHRLPQLLHENRIKK